MNTDVKSSKNPENNIIKTISFFLFKPPCISVIYRAVLLQILGFTTTVLSGVTPNSSVRKTGGFFIVFGKRSQEHINNLLSLFFFFDQVVYLIAALD